MMTFYFYDLETSGINPRNSRIMQFAGQRTDMDLNPIGESDNILIKMTPDVLPDPDAVLITGLTPQQTHLDGVSEAEFLKYFTKEIATDNTIFIGFNNIRFDDEFIRFMLWRNFTDPYEWQWKDGCSRWDLLDVVRMTRALRPAGIKWPFGSDGKPSNKLELLCAINGLKHDSSHDALSDVKATIAVAKLIRQKQPKLFDYLLGLRNKTAVEALVSNGQPLIYTSGRYASEYEKTTVAVMISTPISRPGALMYDLRIAPERFFKMSPNDLAGLWQTWAKDEPVFPVKMLSYNKSPAVAPLSVLDLKSQKRLGLDMPAIEENFKKLKTRSEFSKKLREAFEITIPKNQAALVFDELTVDTKLYDGFVSDTDKIKMSAVRAAEPAELEADNFEFNDERLKLLLPLYKARNFPKFLNDQERVWWETFRRKKLLDGGEDSLAGRYFRRIDEISASKIDYEKRYLLEELNLYGQSILPAGET